jgi:hypothetical protein
MNNAYQVVLGCPECHHGISLPRKSATVAAAEMIACSCGWRGRAGRATLRYVVPFDWIYSAASELATASHGDIAIVRVSEIKRGRTNEGIHGRGGHPSVVLKQRREGRRNRDLSRDCS